MSDTPPMSKPMWSASKIPPRMSSTRTRQQQEPAADERADDEDQVLDRDLEHPPSPSRRPTARVFRALPSLPTASIRRGGRARHGPVRRSVRPGRRAAGGRGAASSSGPNRSDSHDSSGVTRSSSAPTRSPRGTGCVRAGLGHRRIERERDLLLASRRRRRGPAGRCTQAARSSRARCSSAATSAARAALSRATSSARIATAVAPRPPGGRRSTTIHADCERRGDPADAAARDPGDRQRREIDPVGGAMAATGSLGP